ncbi:DUF3726 domain-containing protein [Mesorhizobium sp. CC13]|uniref:DUF3726 domain-containing protein n=1 Tax=Mesorhizobium sp. CC13 TaxID=3029194 RepID=UPI0032670A8B
MTTIQLSYNEVLTVARKAAGGAGLPHGVAEDVGEAAVWLSARGVDAVSIVVDALGSPAEILGAQAAIDALCCGETAEIAAEGWNCRLMLIGLAGAVAAGTEMNLAVRKAGNVEPLARMVTAEALVPSVVGLLLLPFADDGAPTPLRSHRPAATDAAAYAAALGLAAKTYVPASELSRARGAGAGTTDND